MNDKEIKKLIEDETRRQNETLNLIPSENFVSRDVLAALGSVFTNKYAEGYPAARYYGGNQFVDEVENLARSRALEVFGLSSDEWSVNVQPYSGSPANLAIYAALVPLGEKIMGMRLDMGGHLTHGHKVSFTGKAWMPVQYGVDKETEELDYEAIRRLAAEEKPKIIVSGATAYSRVVDFKKFREICDSVGAYMMVDMSHFAGLVAGGVYPSPFKYADVVMTTAHKTLRGPRAGLIFVNKELKIMNRGKEIEAWKLVNRAVFPGLQGGPHVNQIAAIATAMKEAADPSFKEYAQQIVKNARALAKALEEKGFRIVSGGTDSHLFLVDLTPKNITGSEASTKLEGNGIIVNMNTIPYDTRKPMDPSGIRMGTPSLTTRGMKEGEMEEVARLISDVLLREEDVKEAVKSLCSSFPLNY